MLALKNQLLVIIAPVSLCIIAAKCKLLHIFKMFFHRHIVLNRAAQKFASCSKGSVQVIFFLVTGCSTKMRLLLRRITFIFTNSMEHLYNFCKINTGCRYILSENRHKQNGILFLQHALYTFCIILFYLLFFTACNSSREKSSAEDSLSAANKLINHLQKQLQQFPDSVALRLVLANTYDSVQQYPQALAQMDSLIAKDSGNYGLWYTKAQIAEDAKDTLLAMNSYAAALHIYASPDALLSLANLYAETKNNRALLLCSRVKELGMGREGDANCSFIMGIYFSRTGNKTEALKYFDDCIANNYTYMEAYIEKGLVYFDSKEYRNALQVFSFASQVNALDADPYYWQGRCYEMMNMKDSAALRYKQSLSLDKNDSSTKAALQRVAGN